jgi:hypothetical protein
VPTYTKLARNKVTIFKEGSLPAWMQRHVSMSDACEENTCGPCRREIASALEGNDSGKEEYGHSCEGWGGVRVVGSGGV